MPPKQPPKDKVSAPFTDEQIHRLNRLQSGQVAAPPYLCPNRQDGKHILGPNGQGVLKATAAGLSCPSCTFLQTWVNKDSLEALPAVPATLVRRDPPKQGS